MSVTVNHRYYRRCGNHIAIVLGVSSDEDNVTQVWFRHLGTTFGQSMPLHRFVETYLTNS